MTRDRWSVALLQTLGACALLAVAVQSTAAAPKKGKGKPAAKAEEAAASDESADSGSSGGDAGSSSGASSAKVAAPPGGMCIAPETPKAVSSCPSNLGKAKGKIAGTPQSNLRAAKRKVEMPKGFKAKGPSVTLDVATLRNKEKVEQKAESLLRREIEVTLRLIKNTRTTDPRRPDFLLRLA